MSECNCVDMKWADQDFNDIDTAICKMCNEDIHEVIDKKDEAIRILGEKVAEQFLRAEKAEAENKELKAWLDWDDQHGSVSWRETFEEWRKRDES